MKFVRSVRAYLSILGYMFRIFFSLLRGIWKVSRLPHKPVTIFGGARLKPESIYMKKATELAHMLAHAGIPVLTGGGPGIMEAASCGVTQLTSQSRVIGITVPGLSQVEPQSPCLPEVITIDNYAARKWLLIEYSMGYAVFPGGFGTINELTELLTLIQTKLHPRTPVVLIGVDYWQPIVTWFYDSALKQGLIAQEDVKLFVLTDDIMQAYDILVKAHPHARPQTRQG